MKLGLDVHGVVDTFPEVFRKLAQSIIDAGGEVHIITGMTYEDAVKLEGFEELGVPYTHFFSIVEQLTEDGVKIDWLPYGDGGRLLPYAPNEFWDPAKANYCDRVGIDMLIDDSAVYGEHFDDRETIYCQLRNTKRKSYKTRPKKGE